VISILIDSDILIEVSRGRDVGLVSQWGAVAQSESALVCSPVTVAELWHGARPQEHKILEDLFAVIQCIPIDLEIGRRAGDYLRLFAKSHSVELGDALIAAAASVHGLKLWTRNRHHYPMKGLAFF
jgi:predicted nucleic acid-binding protein